MRDLNRLVRLGVFGAAQGVRGEIRVKSYTADPLAIAGYGPLTDGTGTRKFVIDVVRALKADMLVARIDGVATREAADALTGVELFARRSQLPPPAEGEYYHDDLTGLTAVSPAGEPLGRVIAVLNYGAGDILEIAAGADGETRLLPFCDAVAPQIDFDAGWIVIVEPNEIDGEQA